MSSSIIIQQELINLLITAKKAFLQGRDMCDQANVYQQSSEKYIETMDKIHPKLLFVDTHIALQLQALDRMREFIDHKAEECKNGIKSHEAKFQTLTIDLTNIFNLLKTCTVDKDILKVNEERGAEVQKGNNETVTLFDYISDQEIIELQRQADDQIGEIENIHSSLQNQSKNLSAIIQEIQSKREAALSISLEESITEFTNEKIHLQEEESLKMADILTSLMNHYDQVEEATRISQLGPEECEQLDISILKKDDDHLPNITEELRIGLDVVISTNEEIYERMQIYQNVKEELIKVLNQLELFGSGGQADSMLDKLLDSEAEIHDREEELEGYFAQLLRLVDWYQCYSSSYNFLILEIDRRRKAQEKQEAYKQELMKNFENLLMDEIQEQRSWAAQHGQYLPEVLCPFINDPPSRLVVETVNEGSPGTRLPNLSPLSIEKALSQIHKNP